MMRLRLATATATVLALSTLGSTAAANCARPVSYTPKVAGNKVTIEPNNFANRTCPDSSGMLRQDTATNTMVQLADFCSDTGHSDAPKAYVDECVAAGKYRYGYATPYSCVSSACSTDYFVEVTVTDQLPANCVRSTGNSAPRVVNSPPWKSQTICSYQSTRPLPAETGGTAGTGAVALQGGAPGVAGAAGSAGAPSSAGAAGRGGAVGTAGAAYGGSAGSLFAPASGGRPFVAPSSLAGMAGVIHTAPPAAQAGMSAVAPPTGGVPFVAPAAVAGAYSFVPTANGGADAVSVAAAGTPNVVVPQGGQSSSINPAPALALGGATVTQTTAVSPAAQAGAPTKAAPAEPANDSDSGCSIVAPTGTSSVLGLNALAILAGLLLRRSRREKSES